MKAFHFTNYLCIMFRFQGGIKRIDMVYNDNNKLQISLSGRLLVCYAYCSQGNFDHHANGGL